MQFDRFCEMAQVWFLEDFWHVHIATKQELSRNPEFMEHAILVSVANPKYPIRFTSATTAVDWLWNGQIMSPFAPAQYFVGANGLVFMDWAGYDSESGLQSDRLNHKTGEYATLWDPSKRLPKDRPTRVSANIHVSGDWYMSGKAPKYMTWQGYTDETRQGWKELSSAFRIGSTVRYYPEREVIWADKPRGSPAVCILERLDRKDPTLIEDSSVYEQGSIMPNGSLMVVRIAVQRVYHWLSSITHVADQSHIFGPRNRLDGPSQVTVFNIKEIVMNAKTSMTVFGTYKHDWYRGNRLVSGTEVQEWAKRTGTILVDAPCHDRSAFASSMDQVAWAVD